jgi:ribosomal protein S18 acetylase RimI-like enzyme
MTINISTATREDIEAIYALVLELAHYEKAPEEVWATLEDYKKLYDERWFKCIVAKIDNEVVGTCIFYNSFSTWKGKMLYLEDFVIKEKYRNEGIGQQLFDHLLSLAKDEGYTLIKWQVLDWNEPAIKFYEKNKAIIEKEWWNGKILLSPKP